MIRGIRIQVVLAAAVATMACSSSTGPSPSAIGGTWLGSVTFQVQGASPLRMDISQSGSSISGTWSFVGSRTGSLTGTVKGASVTLEMVDPTPVTPNSLGPCSWTALASISGAQLTGTTLLTNSACHRGESGTMALTKL